MRRRSILLAVAVLAAGLLVASLAGASGGKQNLKADDLTGYQENPDVSTGATGSFEATIDDDAQTITYDDYMADFTADFHDLRSAPAGMRAVLDPDSYVESQALAERLLEADSLGVIYPSVRHAGGTCVACFRPALVANVRRGKTYRFTWRGSPEPVITLGR